MAKTFLCLTFLSLILSDAIAQPRYVAKLGKVSLEELRMESYKPDSTAAAVILFDKGKLNGVSGSFTRHVRLKILSSAGTSHANFRVRTPSRGDIEGATYNIVDGQVIESPLKKENIFREKIVDGYEVFKVFFPNVKPGSVVDLRYSFWGLPHVWAFQERIPVMYSEIELESTSHVKFVKMLYGKIPVKAESKQKWIAEEVPAFQEEPFMTDYSNYVTHFKFDIGMIGIYEISTTWEKIGKRLWEYDNFGGVFTNSAFLNAKAKEIKQNHESVRAKIQVAYSYIQEQIKWNKESSAFASDGYWSNFTKNHTGNSADVNLLLTSLLRKCEVKAYPLILSTRENGLLNPVGASLNSINYVAAYIKDGDVEMVLDATSTNLVPGVLSLHCINLNAYVLDDPGKSGWWISTNNLKPFSKRQFIQLNVGESGDVTADITNTYEDYEFLEWIEKLDEAGSEEAFASALMARTIDLKILKCKLTVTRPKLTAIESIQADLSNSEFVQDLGKEVLINPFVLNDFTNPFNSDNREFPVDFISSRKRNIVVSMKVPGNLLISRVPENITLVLQGGGAKFVYKTALSGSILSISYTFHIEKTLFTETEYGSLKAFYTEVNRKLSESIELMKRT
jgi:hypothetical protein